MKSSAGALPRKCGSTGTSSNSACSRASVSSAVTIVSRCQPCWASSGICSMMRSRYPCSRQNRSRSGASMSLTPRISTALTLTGRSPAASAAPQAGEDVVEAVATRQLVEALAVEGVEGDVDACQPGLRERRGQLRQPDAVRRDRHLGRARERRRPRDEARQAGAQQRLPAGEPHLPYAQADRDRHHAHDLVVGQQLRPGDPLAGPRQACSRCSAGCTGRSPRRAGPVATRPNPSISTCPP